MLGSAVNRTWQQVLHPTFRSVFLTGILSALGTLAILLAIVYGVWPESFDFTVSDPQSWVTGTQWIAEGINGLNSWVNEWIIALTFVPVAIIGGWFLFPPIATAVIGAFLDKIIHAVEEEYYPSRLASRHVGLSETIVAGLRLAAMMLLFNLLALVPYIILFFLTGGIGSLLLYLAINGYLLGREYFELVASGHMDPNAARQWRKRHQSHIFTTGVAISGMFLIPFLNVMAPILAAAIMTHVFHSIEETQRP